jgi:putative DNA primase/helicase
MSDSIDFQSIASLALSHARTLVPQWLPTGKAHGVEWRCGGIDGSPGESFACNLSTGKWSDFAAPDSRGGDLISLYAAIQRKSQIEAARELSAMLGACRAPAATTAQEWTPIVPVPEHAAPPPAAHFRHGKPVHTAEYRNADGALIGLILRCEPPGAKKEILPLAYCRRGDGREEWRWLSQGKPRSLYGAERLAAGGRVLIVEGETSADAARRLVGDRLTVVTWPGGSQAVHHADWSMLAGRDCVIWPDADPAGITAAASITVQLRHYNATVRTVTVPEDAPKGWDLADAEAEDWDADRVMAVIDPPEQEQEPEYEPDYDYDDGQDVHVPDFRALGHDNGRFYFFTSGGGQVRDFTARDLLNKGCLVELAPLRYWEMNYPSKSESGFNAGAAGNDLVQACYKVGIYDAARIRGRGAWLDEGRGVLHLGDHCLIDGVRSSIVIPNSRYIYEHSKRMDITLGEQLSNAEANRLRDLCIMLPWEAPAHMGNLLAGWCVIAPICGALPWRPHIWMTGESGSGKTWTLDNIIRMALGQIALEVQSKTTEAGIRQSLGRDGRPVLFDEAESQNESDRARIQQVLDLARQASSEGGAAIVKGSAGGKAMQFHVRSCFMFGSINVGVTQAADENRMVILTLIKPDAEVSVAKFAAIQALHARLVCNNFAGRLLARTLSLLPVIRANAAIFADAIARSGKPRRLGDTYGVLMAGAWSLRSRAVATDDEADRMVQETAWVKEAVSKTEVVPEWQRAIQTLMQHRIRMTAQGKTVEIPVGDLIETAQGRIGDGLIGSIDACRELNYMGMRVLDGHLQIANSSTTIDAIFQKTPWSGSWAHTIKRSPGAKKNMDNARLAGNVTRLFGIPLGTLTL